VSHRDTNLSNHEAEEVNALCRFSQAEGAIRQSKSLNSNVDSGLRNTPESKSQLELVALAEPNARRELFPGLNPCEVRSLMLKPYIVHPLKQIHQQPTLGVTELPKR
jgi:hypothetical protein